MPVPPLTSQLISRIVGHVADGLNEVQRHEEGGRLALVGKAWVGPARDLTWFIVTLEHGGSSPLMDHLLKFPHLLEHVKALEFRGLTTSEDRLACAKSMASADSEDSEDDEADENADMNDFLGDLFLSKEYTPAPFVRLMNSCPSLRYLALPCCDPTAPFLDVLKTTPSKAELSTLLLSFMSIVRFNVAVFVHRLISLTNLDDLNIRIGLHASTEWSADIPTPKLQVKSLSLMIYGCTPIDNAKTFTAGLLACLDLSCLQSVTLDKFDGHTSILEHLPACPNLSSLRIKAYSPSMLQLALSSLVPVLPDLQALEDIKLTTVEIGFNAFQADSERLPSPLPLDTLLARLPASFKCGSIDGVYFKLDESTTPAKASKRGRKVRGILRVMLAVSAEDTNGEADGPLELGVYKRRFGRTVVSRSWFRAVSAHDDEEDWTDVTEQMETLSVGAGAEEKVGA
ncbi:hypothetical protein JCM10450v2_006351 [Rhodotorula kratochvilovae]